MTTKEGIRVASVDRILQRVRTDDNFTVKPVRYFGQRNGARHNPYAAGVKKYELNGGRFNNDATTAYDLPRPIKSRGGRPVKNSPGSTDGNSDNSVENTESCSTSSPAQLCATTTDETTCSETGETEAGIQTSVGNSEIMQVKATVPQRTSLRRSTRSCVREIEAKQSPVGNQAKNSGSGDEEIVLVENEKPQSVEEVLKTPPPLLQHPISVVMPSGLGSAASRPPQTAPTLPMLFNKGAQCWIPVAPQLASPLATWHHEAQEFVSAPECYWIAGLAPSAKPGCRDSGGITPENVTPAHTPRAQPELKEASRHLQNLAAVPFDSSVNENTSPCSWTIEEVVTFIGSVPGCAKHSEAFRSQEIDGEALLLLDVDQLVSRLGMKLGPAAKVWARLSKLTGQS